MSQSNDLAVNLLLLLILVGIVILFVRAIVLWYWRVNEQVENQKEIIQLLEQIRDLQALESRLDAQDSLTSSPLPQQSTQPKAQPHPSRYDLLGR